jgi:hypothetical protein
VRRSGVVPAPPLHCGYPLYEHESRARPWHDPPQTPSFRRPYLRPDSPLPDSPRFRRRLATIVPELWFKSFEEQQRDANAWLALVREVFAEEHMAYRIDDNGVVHPLVDQAFEAVRVSVIGALAGDAFNAARAHFENAIAALEEDPPDTRGAVRDCFDAAENLFKLLTGTGQDLTQSNVTATLKPVVDRLHGVDPATQSHAGRMLSSFADWANAGHPYRHAQAGTETQAPTVALAVLYLSTGAGFIRWLAHMLTMARL